MTALRQMPLVVLAFVVSACGSTGSSDSAASSAPSVASLAPTPTATAAPVVSARLISGVGGLVRVSPDGKWIALTPPQSSGKGIPYTPTIELHDADGKMVRAVEVPTPNWTWMPDSSGFFVALDVPQRPASLGLLDITGAAPRVTGLMMAGETLSRDGSWIVAAQAEGCCMFVTYPEIRIAPRSGGDVKTLVSAKTDPKGLALLGIDAADRVVYRDGGQIFRVAVRGGTPQQVGTIQDFATTLAGNSSPDGTVILIRGYEPLRWYVIANDRVSPWPDNSHMPVEDLQGERLLFGTAGLWTGPHTLLVRASSGGLSSFDALTGLSTATKASLRADDVALAHDRGRVLVGRAARAVVIDLASGTESDVGLDFGAQSDGARAWRAAALPGGGFILSTLTSTYRID